MTCTMQGTPRNHREILASFDAARGDDVVIGWGAVALLPWCFQHLHFVVARDANDEILETRRAVMSWTICPLQGCPRVYYLWVLVSDGINAAEEIIGGV
jgi:hypothetical protein